MVIQRDFAALAKYVKRSLR